MEKRAWKIITICFIVVGLLFIGIGIAYPFKQDITSKLLQGLAPSEIGDVDLYPTIDLTLLGLDPSDLDQKQEHNPGFVLIGEYPGACLAQGVVNSRDSLLGIKVLLKTVGLAQKFLFAGIMTSLGDPTKTASYAKLGAIPPGTHPKVWTWLSLDFSDDPLDIKAGNEFWIVLFSTEDVTDNTYRRWAASIQAPYPQDLKVYDFNQNKWIIAPIEIDTCFRTYTPSEDPPPECSPDGCTKCKDNDLYTCIDGNWILTEENSPECSAPPPPSDDFFVSHSGRIYTWVKSCEDHSENPTHEAILGETCYAYCRLTNVKARDVVKFEWRLKSEPDSIRHTSDVILEQGGDICIWDIWVPDLEGKWYVKVWVNGFSRYWYTIPIEHFSVIAPSPPTPPEIGITFSTSVMAVGFLNLLGAALSFAKFRLIR